MTGQDQGKYEEHDVQNVMQLSCNNTGVILFDTCMMCARHRLFQTPVSESS